MFSVTCLSCKKGAWHFFQPTLVFKLHFDHEMMTCRVMFDMFLLTCLSCEKGEWPFF